MMFVRFPVARSKKRIDLSLPAVASVLPSGEIATAVTALVCSLTWKRRSDSSYLFSAKAGAADRTVSQDQQESANHAWASS